MANLSKRGEWFQDNGFKDIGNGQWTNEIWKATYFPELEKIQFAREDGVVSITVDRLNTALLWKLQSLEKTTKFKSPIEHELMGVLNHETPTGGHFYCNCPIGDVPYLSKLVGLYYGREAKDVLKFLGFKEHKGEGWLRGDEEAVITDEGKILLSRPSGEVWTLLPQELLTGIY